MKTGNKILWDVKSARELGWDWKDIWELLTEKYPDHELDLIKVKKQFYRFLKKEGK